MEATPVQQELDQQQQLMEANRRRQAQMQQQQQEQAQMQQQQQAQQSQGAHPAATPGIERQSQLQQLNVREFDNIETSSGSKDK